MLPISLDCPFLIALRFSLDCPFLIAPSVFFKIYYLQNITQKTKDQATRTPLKQVMDSGAPSGLVVPAALVAPVVLDTAKRHEHYLIWKSWGTPKTNNINKTGIFIFLYT